MSTVFVSYWHLADRPLWSLTADEVVACPGRLIDTDDGTAAQAASDR
jgi:hypothetical protein